MNNIEDGIAMMMDEIVNYMVGEILPFTTVRAKLYMASQKSLVAGLEGYVAPPPKYLIYSINLHS